MKLIKSDSPYLNKDQWRKVFLAATIMTLVLYTVAMVCSLLGSKYFIMNYQNANMDNIENFFHKYSIYPLLANLFITLEFFIVLAFTLGKLPKWYYILIFYALPLIIHYSIGGFPNIVHSIYPFLFYLTIPLIEQYKDTKHISGKLYLKQLIRLIVASIITFILQIIIFTIKDGHLSTDNHYLNLSSAFIYSLEYDIALFVVLFTIQLYINREKGDRKVWTTGQPHGGSSQTTKTNSQKLSSLTKSLSKTQKNKLKRFWIRFYLTQVLGFLLLMVLPFLLGKVIEFLTLYLSFAIARYILGFKYSLHYKKENLCITVGVIIFGVLSLTVPFFYVNMICAIAIGVLLAILLHLSYKYKSFYLFNKIAKPDKFALLYVFFDEDLSEPHVKRICKYKGLTDDQVNLIVDYTQGNKITYLSNKYNYSLRMLIYKLDEAIDKLIN